MMMTNPWKGLDSYKESEKIYGRDEEIDVLFSKIEYNVQTVVYGRSGIGKSSIINAGIFPKARQTQMLPVSIRLIHTTDKAQPSEPYVTQIRNAIETELQLHGGVAEEIVPHKEGHDEEMWEFLHRFRFWMGEDENRYQVKPLLVFDQFEEIFTLEKDHQRVTAFFAQMAAVFNGITPEYLTAHEETAPTPKPTAAAGSSNIFSAMRARKRAAGAEYLDRDEFHIVFTLREDYLSYLERNTTHIPSLKLNRYCLQPINEEQAAIIITEPVPGLVDRQVAKLIIEKVTGETDFELDGRPEILVDSAILSLYLSRLYGKRETEDSKITAELVDRFGDNIIQDFYVEAIDGLPEPIVEYLEDNLLNNEGRRENISVYNAKHIGHLTEQQLKYLCDDKKLLRPFAYGGDMRIEFIHDILCPVIKERRDMRQMLKQQEEERQKLLQEEKRKRHELEEKARLEKEEMERQARRVKRRNRQRMTLALFIIAFLLLIGGGWFVLTQATWHEYYGAFTTKKGWPIGIGKELSKGDKAQMPVHYVLIRNGWLPERWGGKPFTVVEVRNAKGELVRNKFVESPVVNLYETEGNDQLAIEFARLQRQTAIWRFTPDNEGNISRKTAYSIEDKELYDVQYFQSADQLQAGDSLMYLWANYTDKEGKSMRVRDNGADRVRIKLLNGYVVNYAFYSETGSPQPNQVEAYGYDYVVDEEGRVVAQAALDEFGDSLSGRSIVNITYDDYGRWVQSSAGHAEYSLQQVVYAVWQNLDTLKFSPVSGLQYHSEVKGNFIWNVYHYSKGQVTDVAKYHRTEGGMCLDSMRTVLPPTDETLRDVLTYGRLATVPYQLERTKSQPGKTVITYWQGKDKEHITQPALHDNADGAYHQLEADTTKVDGVTRVTKVYKDTQGQLCQNRPYNREVFDLDRDGNRLSNIQYKGDATVKSYLFYYDSGLMVAQSVMGVDGKPVRCAQWDALGLCYYQLKFVRNFNGSIIAIKGINEFGEESLITNQDMVYTLSIVPSQTMFADDLTSVTYGVQAYRESVMPVANEGQQVTYLHILDRQGSYYKAGIRDGDLLLSSTAGLKVARPNPTTRQFDILTFAIPQGDTGAETYPIYYNKVEMERLNQSIARQK